MKKRLISILLIFMILCSFLSQVTFYSFAARSTDTTVFKSNSVELGDYIYLGTYYGEPICWRCVAIDENGPLMLSDKVLCFKALDAAGTSSKYHSDGWGYIRRTSGSNCWSDSSIRQWLNSSDESVNYTHCPPIKGAVTCNPYASEAGFLCGFSESELIAIKTTTNLVNVNEWETTRSGYCDGGSRELIWKLGLNADYQQYYYQMVTDKIFLLTAKQADEVYKNFGNYLTLAYPTITAVNNSEKGASVDTNKTCAYFLNIPRNEGASYECVTTLGDNSLCYGANNGAVGIRPAFYLDVDAWEGTAATHPDSFWKGNSVNNIPVGESLTILANQNASNITETNYKLCNCATVLKNGTEYTTERNGNVIIPSGNGSVTVSKEGYISRTYSEEVLERSKTVYLQKESKYPVISGVWMDNTDIMNEAYEVPLINSGTFAVTAEISWGESSEGSVKLMQSDRSVALTNGAANVTWSDSFDVSKPIYIVATNADGMTSKKMLKLETASALNESLNNFSVDWGSDLSFQMPDALGSFLGESKISVGIFESVPFSYTIEDGKIFVALGVRFGTEREDGKFKAKSFTQDVKKLFEDYSVSGVKELLKEWRGDIKSCKGAVGIEADFSVMGFVEGYFTPEGTIVWLDSGAVVGLDGSVDYSVPFYVGPVPMFFETKLGAEIETKLNLYINEAASSFTPRGSLTGDVSLSGGLGIGIKKLLTVSGGLRGKLGNTWEFGNNTNYYQMKASLNGYVKAEALFFTWEKQFDPMAEKVLIEYPEKKHSAAGELLDLQGIYDADCYQPQDLRYLQEGSAFLGNAAAPKRGVSAEKNTVTELLTNAYTGAAPQLVTFSDGTMLAAWIGYDEAQSGYNRLCLYASYYNGAQWSAPAVVETDGTYDAAPRLTLIDGTAYLTWLDGAQPIAENSEMETVAGQMDISLAVFDKQTQSFTVTAITEANNTLDAQPVVCGDGSALYVVWLNNSENDWFGINGENSIRCRSFDGTAWGEEQLLYTGISSVDSLTADYDGAALHIAYSADADGDLATGEDIEVFLDGMQLTDNAVLDSGVQYLGHTLYWNQNGALVTQEMTVMEQLGTDRYQLIEENGVRVLLYTQADGLCSIVYAVFYDSGKQAWGAPIALTDGASCVQSFDAAVSSDGTLQLLANTVAVIGGENGAQPYGEATVVLLSVPLTRDLSVEDIFYDCETYVEKYDMTFDVAVKNKGELAAEDLLVTVTDEAGTELSKNVYAETLLPGETKNLTCGFAVSQAELGKTVFITVSPLNESDTNMTDNRVEAVLEYDNLSLEETAWGINEDGKAVVYGDVINRSYASYENVRVNLRSGSKDGEIVSSAEIAALNAFDIYHASFEVEYAEGKVYYITVEAEDMHRGDNSDFVVLQGNACEHAYDSVRAEATCTEDGSVTYTCSLCGNSYTELISALGHDYRHTETVRPTAASQGYDVYTCTRCADSYRDNYVEAVTQSADALKFKRASLTLESDISINFYVLDSVLEGWNDPYVVFTKAVYDEKGSITGYETETVTEFTLKAIEDGSGCHVFTFTGIYATEMGSAVTATLYASKDGTVYEGRTVNYSVLQYVTNMLNKSTDAGLRTMLVDLLNYGAAAQSYYGYNAANLVNAGLTEEQQSYATQGNPTLSTCRALIHNEGATVSFKSCTLYMKEKVSINYYLNLSNYAGAVDDLCVKISYTDENGKAWTQTIDSSELLYKQYNGSYYYVANFSALNAMQMRTECRAEVFSKATGERISNTLLYSIESFAYSKANDPDTGLAYLVNAMMKYGNAVEAYFLP